MKCISLNCWGGRLGPAFDAFVSSHAADTDVFCFQEVNDGLPESARDVPEERTELLAELKQMLPDFAAFFRPQGPGIGIATFVRRTRTTGLVEARDVLSAEDLAHLSMPSGAKLYARPALAIELPDAHITVVNFHGVPGDMKRDNPQRALQVERLAELLDGIRGQVVLVGDFNVNPDTSAIGMLAARGMRDLVAESGALTTRTDLYPKHAIMPFSDYAFVDPDVEVANFAVLQDVVSDHLPLMVELR